MNLRFVEGEGLVLERPGEAPRAGLTARRAFPLADPERWIALLDDKLEEVLMIEDGTSLDLASREALSQSLAREYLWPRIVRILSLKEHQGISDWDVETDRGPVRFQVHGMRSSAAEVSEGRYVIMDMTGARFEIPDIGELDPKSQSLVRRWV